MNEIHTTCPACGKVIQTYMDNVEADDWTIIQPHRHESEDDERAAKCKGCVEVATVETIIWCEHCDAEIKCAMTYNQPCNDNGWLSRRTYEWTGAYLQAQSRANKRNHETRPKKGGIR